LNLNWYQAPGSRGMGHCCQVAKIWLIKKEADSPAEHQWLRRIFESCFWEGV